MKVEIETLIQNFVIEPIDKIFLLVITDDCDRVVTAGHFETLGDAQSALNLIHVFKLRCGLSQKARNKSAVTSQLFIEDFKAAIASLFPVEGGDLNDKNQTGGT